jgi:Cu-processing system ATP-binding protein
MTPAVAVSGLNKRLAGRDILRDIDLTLDNGLCAALIGHNGAGKTSLIKALLGLLRPTSGAVKIFGEDPNDARMRGRIGFLPENVSFSPNLTGRELLAFYAKLKGVRPSAAMALLDRVGLNEAASRPIRVYSKGMRQRLGLAQALIGAPGLLLLDEPTTGLDDAMRQSFYQIILELRNAGASVLLSSHSLTELAERADRLIIMHHGAIIADGAIGELQKIAALPVRMRVSAQGGLSHNPVALGPVQDWRKEGHSVEFSCAAENKIAVLRTIFQSPAPIDDIIVTPPTLDQLYAHFLKQRGAST